MEWDFAEPAYNYGIEQISICGLKVVGSVGNSMTLQFGGSPVAGAESLNLVGHDAT